MAQAVTSHTSSGQAATGQTNVGQTVIGQTVIGKSLVIDGEISGSDALLVEGTVKGRVAVTERVEVTHSALVEAEIEALAVTISGQVTGNLTVRDRIEIRPEGRVIGDVRAPRVQIADGATFKGKIDMSV